MEEEFIEEEYVSFETAKMLKEADFNWMCDALFSENGAQMSEMNFKNYNKAYPYTFSRPTQALAAKWLREKHRLHVFAEVHRCSMIMGLTDIWYYTIFPIGENCIVKNCICGMTKYRNYEVAMEAGLQEAIRLLNKHQGEHNNG